MTLTMLRRAMPMAMAGLRCIHTGGVSDGNSDECYDDEVAKLLVINEGAHALLLLLLHTTELTSWK